MTRKLYMLAAFALAACGGEAPPPAAAPAVEGAWIVDKAASRVEFSGTQTGKAFTGAFEEFDATIVFDPADLVAARIEAVIDTNSAKTGDRQRDAALPGAEWFSVKAFPDARFVSETIAATGDGAYEARGRLSIRGVEREIVLPFTLAIAGDRATADASLTLNRAEYAVGQGEFATDKWVAFDVKVAIHIEATR